MRRYRGLDVAFSIGVLGLILALPVWAEGEQVTFHNSPSQLPAEFQPAFERMLAYDYAVLEDPKETVDTLLSAATIDLNGDGQAELLMPIFHAFHGNVPQLSVVVAHKTAAGWRFAGVIVAPDSRNHEPYTGLGIFVEKEDHAGWRNINNGPRWVYRRLNGEEDLMGGDRYCWTETPEHPYGDPKPFFGWGIPYDAGGPGYFNQVAIDEPCPE